MQSVRLATVALALALALVFSPGASAAKDYTKNGATGDYAPAAKPSAGVAPSADQPTFAWGDAAIGAGAALGFVLAAGALCTGFVRTRPFPRAQ
jgi:hypothetical protein